METSGKARHQGFSELAAKGPIHHLTLFTGVPVWLVTGYPETRELLAHPDVVRSLTDGPHRAEVTGELVDAMENHMLTANPPDHTRLRKLVSAAFTRRRIERLEPRIREIATGLLDEMAAAGGEVDLVGAYSYPLPITVILTRGVRARHPPLPGRAAGPDGGPDRARPAVRTVPGSPARRPRRGPGSQSGTDHERHHPVARSDITAGDSGSAMAWSGCGCCDLDL